MADQEYKVRLSVEGAEQAAAGAKKVDTAIGGIGKKALEAGVAMFAAGGIIAALQQITQLSTRAIQVSKVGDAFANMANKSGLAANTLDRLRTATRGTVSDFELMKSANTIMLLGVTKSTDQMAEMAEIARRLGSAVGLDAVSALDSLVIGIGRQSKLMLDNLGIIVDVEQAYRNYAKELGKTVDQLTDAEKKTGFTNEAMKKARDLVSGLGDDSETTGDSLSRLNTQWQNTKDNLEELLPVATGVAWVLSKIAAAAGLVLKGEESEVWKKSTSELKLYLDALNGGLGAQFANRLVSQHGDGLVEMFGKLRAEVEQTKKEMGNSDFADNLIKQIDAAQKAYDAAAPERATAAALAHAKAIEEEKRQIEAILAPMEARFQAQEIMAESARAFDELMAEMNVSRLEQIAEETQAELVRAAEIRATRQELDDWIISEGDRLFAADAAGVERQARLIAQQIEDRKRLKEATGQAARDMIGSVASLNQAYRGSAILTKRLLQAEAVANTYAAADKALNFGPGPPLTLPLVALTVAQGLANAAQIQSQNYREGGVIEGAGGPRQDNIRINASPGESILNAEATARLGRDGVDRLNGGGGAGVTVVINGGMIGSESFVRDVMIPQIEASLKRRLA